MLNIEYIFPHSGADLLPGSLLEYSLLLLRQLVG